jgi:hypothetical protein
MSKGSEIDYQLEPSDLPVQAPTKYSSDAGLKLCIVRGAGQKQREQAR